jgi:hypothetical protein
MDLLSVNEYGSYAIPSGEDFEYPGGFSKLIQYLANKISQSRIKLSCPVKHISQCKEYSDSKILVECFNGQIFRTNHVVITTSVNYLKKHVHELIEPDLLTEKKLESIDRIKMDTVDKICLFYNDMSFYPKDTNSIHPLFFSELSQNKINPEKKTAREENNWLYKTYSFDKFYDHMLIVWMTGEEADHVENLSEEQISQMLTDLLRRFLNNPQVPFPDKIIRTQWNLNPYILGRYTL